MNYGEPPSVSVAPTEVKYAWVARKAPPTDFGKDLHQDVFNQVAWELSRDPLNLVKPKETSYSRSELWERFAQTTTGHGFARLVDRNEPKSWRLFWLLALVLLISGLLVTVLLISYEALIVRGLRREFIVQNNKSMFLPDIHICDTSPFNRTVLQELGLNDTLASYLALSLSHILASRSIIEDLEKRKLLNEEFRRLTKGKSIQSIFEIASLKCEDIILGCSHDNHRYSSLKCCSKFFGNRRYVTDLATLCVSTHYQPPLEEMFDFQIYGFVVYLKTNTHERFEFDSTIISSNIASRHGIMYAVSDSITAVNPTISTAGQYTTPGTWTSVSISLTRTDNTELQKGILATHSCVFPDSPDHLHLVPNHYVYSQRNCVFGATRLVLEEKLNCSRFRFDKMGSLAPCHPDVMIGVHSPRLASEIKQKIQACPEDCVFNDYRVSSSTTQLDLNDHDDMHVDEQHDDRFVHTAIHFFYPSFTFTVIKNHPENLVQWLSDVGGNMSLYLGASFVTLLELFVLLFRCVRNFLK